MNMHQAQKLVERLPGGMHLYVSHGVTNLFERVNVEGDGHAKESWIWLPDTLVREFTERAIRTYRDSEWIDIDDRQSVLLTAGGQCWGVMIWDSEESAPKPNDVARLANVGQRGSEPTSRESRELATRFIRNLFRRDNSLDQFLASAVKFLTGEWRGSYSAMYGELDGVFRVRHAGGSLDFCHLLPAELNFDLGSRVDTVLEAGGGFITSDVMPERPVFLDSAPDVLFVHPGVQADQTRMAIILAGSGQIQDDTVHRVRAISELIAQLHETQFATVSDVTALYSRLVSGSPHELALHDLLLDIFDILAPQMNLTRFVVMVLPSGKRPGTAQVVTPQAAAARRVDHATDISFPDSIIQAMMQNRQFHVGNVADRVLSDRQIRQRYLANVKSEIYLPVKRCGAVRAMIAFGSSVEGDYLLNINQLLTSVADFIGLFLTLSSPRFLTKSALPHASVENQQDDAQTFRSTSRRTDRNQWSRVALIRTLMQGYTHDMLGLLSVIMGTADVGLLRPGADTGDHEAIQRVTSGLARINAAADTLSEHFGALDRLLAVADTQPGTEIELASFVRALPSMLHGLTRQRRDTDDINIRIVVEDLFGGSVRVDSEDLYDRLLPMIVEGVQVAEVSGNIRVSLETTNGGATLTLECDRHIFGSRHPGYIIERVFYRNAIDWNDTNSGSISTASTRITFCTMPSGLFRMAFHWTDERSKTHDTRRYSVESTR